MINITLNQASLIATAAIRKAQDLGINMNIAIVDVSGVLLYFARMDGAGGGSVDIAYMRAKTASNDELTIAPSGILIKNRDGEIVGAIGVSGSIVENDHIVAKAGANMYCKQKN